MHYPAMPSRSALFILLLLGAGEASPKQYKRRRNTWYVPVATAAEQVLSRAAELLHISTPPLVFHSQDDGAKNNLIDALWGQTWPETIASRFSDANPAFTFLMEQQTVDAAEEPTRFRELQGQSRWEATIRALFRARSQQLIPIETAALSIMWLYYRVPTPVWHAVSYFGKSVMSRLWTEGLCDLAVARDPGPSYPVAEGITAAVFDNFMMNVDYTSFSQAGQAGHKIEMTNWASVFLPAAAMPADFPGMDAVLGAGGIFRSSMDIEDFLDSFSIVAPDIVANQRVRWATYLAAAAIGSVWDTELYSSPYPPTKFHFHHPIFDRLQSSYEDVNFEINVMRRSSFHKLSDALMLGGGGLSFMRMIHRLSQDPRKYLETKPIIMPRMGENPHGLFHFMHGDWRIWSPLLLRLAVITDNKQLRADPTIVDFNKHQHFLRIVIQALAEYVVEISHTGTDYRATQQFLADAEKNLSFAYIVYFLYMFGFKFLDYR